MTVDRSALREFLFKNKRNSARGRDDLGPIEPFFRKAEAGLYDLAAASEVDEGGLRQAVRIATGRRVERFSFISLTDASAAEGDHAAFWDRSAKEIGLKLSEGVSRKFVDTLKRHLGIDTYERLQATIWSTVGEPLWHAFEQNCWEEARYSVAIVARAGILCTLSSYIGFTLVGERGWLDYLGPLVTQLPRVIPLGEQKANPGVWTAMAA